MSTDRATLEASLEGMDVASVRTPAADLAATIEECVRGEAVGVEDEDWGEVPPDAVDWDPTPAALARATTGVTPAAFAVADYGSLVLPTAPPACELVALHVDRHVAVLPASGIVPDMAAAFDRLAEAVPGAYRDAVVATGPSATADMGALVRGAHGPSEVQVVVLED